jgi:ABC-type arginine/histidine transport system permease subunit
MRILMCVFSWQACLKRNHSHFLSLTHMHRVSLQLFLYLTNPNFISPLTELAVQYVAFRCAFFFKVIALKLNRTCYMWQYSPIQ